MNELGHGLTTASYQNSRRWRIRRAPPRSAHWRTPTIKPESN